MTVHLTDVQRAELRRIFTRFADRVERVDVFGSRTGPAARPGSDVDLAIDGDLDWATLAEIRAALDESYLSIHADVIAYRLTEAGPFRREVQRHAEPLFHRHDLHVTPDHRA